MSLVSQRARLQVKGTQFQPSSGHSNFLSLANLDYVTIQNFCITNLQMITYIYKM